MTDSIFSLGHSDLSFERFVDLLKSAGVTAVADVRSTPFSKRSPWFSQHDFKGGLRRSNLAYSFMGNELGGRPKSPQLFRGGIADYAAMADTDFFRSGLARLLQGCEKHRIAMVCSERDPLHCHRCLLVGRQLLILGVDTRHIHAGGRQESQREAEERLLQEEGLAHYDLLRPQSERINEAYHRRSSHVAYSLG